MWQLPALVAGTKLVRLPATDWAARQIVAALLTEEVGQRSGHWRQLLAEEPPFLLWVVSASSEWRQRPPGSLEVIVEWLDGHALDLFGRAIYPLVPVAGYSTDCRSAWGQQAAGAAVHSWDGTPGFAVAPGGNVVLELRRRIGRPALWWPVEGESGERAVEGSDFGAWVPEWLLPDDRTAAPSELEVRGEHSSTAERLARWHESNDLRETDGSIAARQLETLLARLRRLDVLEHEFALQLRDAKLASLKQFAYGASHEINNPLANIATRAQALLVDEVDSDRKRKLATIAAQAFRAHEMISDLMLFARPPALRREWVDLVDLVDCVLTEMRDDARNKRVALQRGGENESAWAWVDTTQFSVAIQALVRNGIEAVDAGGSVEVALTCEAPEIARPEVVAMIKIAVSDSGPGIAPQAREHLFDPFYSGREAGRGLGFGLPKCWRIVTDHGGRIDVLSTAQGGAQFVIRVPVGEHSPRPLRP